MLEWQLMKTLPPLPLPLPLPVLAALCWRLAGDVWGWGRRGVLKQVESERGDGAVRAEVKGQARPLCRWVFSRLRQVLASCPRWSSGSCLIVCRSVFVPFAVVVASLSLPVGYLILYSESSISGRRLLARRSETNWAEELFCARRDHGAHPSIINSLFWF